MNLTVLTIDSICNDSKLLESYKSYTKRYDLCYDIDYLKVNALHEKGNTHIAILADSKEIVAAYPFIKRKFSFKEISFYDIATPYEYGGVIGKSSESVKKFYLLFDKYCLEKNIVCDFQRVNPFNIHFESMDLSAFELSNQNIVVDLRQDLDQIFANFHKNNRRDIRYAKKHGVLIEKGIPTAKNLRLFKEIYISTMAKKDASELYYFNEEYFSSLKHLGEENLNIFIARNSEGIVTNAALILKKGIFSHYHLSGTDRTYTKLCGNNLLLYEVIRSMKNEGRSYFHLGGASKTQEGLYKFKSKFSDQRVDYYINKRIINTKVYNDTIDSMISLSPKLSELRNDSFFPLYKKLKTQFK